MILEGKNISFTYPCGKKEVLSQTALSITSGERVGLMAPSGFGKTTLCRILAGYEKPTKGQVLLDGKPLPKKGYQPVQLIWQHPEQAVNPKLTMAEILAEGDAVEERVIAGLGIEKAWLNRFPAELSGGELQRFCIARALGKRTRFILADEITAMLDLVTQSQLWHFLLAEVKTRNIGLLVVSHWSELLEKVCQRIITLDQRSSQWI